MRFCGHCGAALSRVCPRCGGVNLPGFKFCSDCGFNLQAGACDNRGEGPQLPTRSRLGERREVTVLFADLSDFTGMARRLDAEDVYNIAGECFSQLAEAVQRYEGTVDKFTGDGIMALFGAPVAHENDPERAVRCALEMQAALAELNRTVQSRYDVEIKARIGINVGTVVAGIVGAPDQSSLSPYTVIGDSVNVAARLQQAARPGQILVGFDVYERTRMLINYRDGGLLNLKGMPSPLPAYAALGLRQKPGPVRGLHGLRAPRALERA